MQQDSVTSRENKYKWCKRILVFALIILFMRLFDLQILKGEEMKRLSEQNRVRIKKIVAPRGTIFDRNGKIVGDTRPSFNLYLIREDIKDFTQTVDGIVGLLQLDREEVIARLKDARDFPSSFPVKIQSDMTMDQVAKVEANKFYLPGVTIQIEPKRNYPYGTMLSHVLGYVSEISGQELKRPEHEKYSPGDAIGKFGLEKMYEGYLRGIDGEKRVEVDASGREVRVLDIVEPLSGNSLYLNIDMDVQEAIEKAYDGKDGDPGRKGGAVVSDPRTGGVLALVSRPSFDPNQLSSGSKEYWQSVAMDELHPLQNRAIQGRFPPGSTFKVLLALEALERGIIDEHTSFTCRGGFFFGNRVFRCWEKRGHGTVSVHRGIVESCDVFFYNVGLRLGINAIHDAGEKVGLTRLTGIDLPGEKKGLIPSPEWKKKTFKEKWYEGETVSVSIGQGAVWLTPLSLMQLAAFIGNEGVTFKPQIVSRVVSPNGKVIKVFKPEMTANVKLHKKAVTLVKDGMMGVVNEPRGTAKVAQLQQVSMSGKTGTAQSVGLGKGGKGDHAWFIAYAPNGAPSVAMGILVEHGGHGGSASAPVAKAVGEILFKQEMKNEMKSAQANVHR